MATKVFRVDGDLRAEAPTNVGRDRADPLSIDVEQLRQVVADVERHLGRHPNGVTVSLGDDGDPVGLHRHRGEALVHEAPLDHDVRAGEDVLVPVVLEAVGNVRADRREQQRSAVLRGQLGIGHRVQGVGRRSDQLGGVLRLSRGFRDHDREGFADEPQPIAGKGLAIEGLVQLSAGSLHVAGGRLGREFQVVRRVHGDHARHRTSLAQSLHPG